MIKFPSSTLALIIAILLYAGLVKAQQNNSTEQSTPHPNPALQQKAFDLLESLASQVNGLQSGENRARIGSNIVGSIWTHDEKRARALLVAVQEDIKAGLQSSVSDDPVDRQSLMIFLRLREDTVGRIAKHDAEAALAFLKATRVISSKELPVGPEQSDSILELRLAKQIAASNPDVALKLARQSLARGLSDDLVSLLRQLSKKHRDQTQTLYKEIVAKLRDTQIAGDWATMSFALNLAQSFSPPVVDDSLYRDLINVYITAALANGCGRKASSGERPYYCHYMASLLPQMEKIDPVRTAPLKQSSSEYHGSYPVSAAYSELRELNQDGTVDEILALSAKYPQMEPEIHWQAMMKALSSGDLERAKKIATDYTGDSERKQRMMDQVGLYRESASMNQGELAELQSSRNGIPRVMDRLVLLISVANSINDRKQALQLLNQASGIAETMKPGMEQTAVQMGLAMFYCLEKSDRGFAIMESLLPKLNELIASAAKLDGYDTRYLRDGEWNMTAEGVLGNMLTSLSQNAGYFAWCDFDRAVSLTAQFDRQEIRLMAQLKLAQGILAGPPKRPRLPRREY